MTRLAFSCGHTALSDRTGKGVDEEEAGDRATSNFRVQVRWRKGLPCSKKEKKEDGMKSSNKMTGKRKNNGYNDLVRSFVNLEAKKREIGWKDEELMWEIQRRNVSQ